MGAAIATFQTLCEQLSRGSRGSGSGSRVSGSSYLDAPEAPGAAISRLPWLREQPSRGSRGSGSSHLEDPEALEAQLAPTSVFSSFLEYSRAWRPLGERSQQLRVARGGLPAASRVLKTASRWLRVASRALRSGLGTSEVASSGLESARRGSGTHREPPETKSPQLESAIESFFHGLVLLDLLSVAVLIHT